MALTLQQLQAMLDAINTELGNTGETVRTADGRSQTTKPVADLLKAKADMRNKWRPKNRSMPMRKRCEQLRF